MNIMVYLDEPMHRSSGLERNRPTTVSTPSITPTREPPTRTRFGGEGLVTRKEMEDQQIAQNPVIRDLKREGASDEEIQEKKEEIRAGIQERYSETDPIKIAQNSFDALIKPFQDFFGDTFGKFLMPILIIGAILLLVMVIK